MSALHLKACQVCCCRLQGSH